MTRKKYSPEQKMQIVKEAMETGNASIVGRRYDVAPSLISRWVRTYKKHGTLHPTGQEKGETLRISCSPKEHKAVKQENEKLKKLLGEKDLEIAILRDLLKKQTHT
ncbi:transposase [Desulfofundulus thermobenzoicus]|uniref:Transposase n=1 Tax=Desulfofundulus thermobenzoicus TaxID=29376 RepID=A0A6N7INM5_9FIRM|nr:transposase [Desulfofundulus thermobenzoicus]MQL51625.1 transposase [Desulfofundulus thermobenzoicus]